MKIKISNIYYTNIILILLNNWITETKILFNIYENFKIWIILSICLLSLIQVLITRYKLKENIFLLIILILCIYTSYKINNTWLIYLFISAVFSKDKDINIIMQIISNSLILFFSINFISFLIMYFFYSDNLLVLYTANKIRWNINFLSPNNASRYLIFLTLSYFYKTYRKNEYLKWIFLFFISGIVYIFTKSEALLIIPLIFILKMSKNNQIINYLVDKFSKVGFFILWGISYISILIPNSKIIIFLDKLSTGRFKLGLRAIEYYGKSFFGNNVSLGSYMNINDSFVYMGIDNAYLYFMVKNGIIYLVIIGILFFKSNSKLDYKSKVCISIYCIYCLFENSILSPSSFFPIIIAVNSIFNNSKKTETYLIN